MDWVDPLANPGAAGTFGDLYKNKDAGSGTPGSVVPAALLNAVQAEIVQVIDDAGLTPDSGDLTQLSAAISALITAGLPSVDQDRVYVTTSDFEAGVADGDAVYWHAGNGEFTKAVGDGSAAANAVGLADVTGGEVTVFGEHTAGISGLTPGARQYLHGSTAGDMTETQPATNAVKIGLAKSATVVWVDIDRLDVGMVVKTSYASSGDVATTTGTIAFDDTIPQDSEGGEFLSVTHTPLSATNKLLIEVLAFFQYGGSEFVGAVFESGTADAIAAQVSSATSNNGDQLVIREEVTAGGTSPITFKFRAGGATGGTLTMNGDASARRLGGKLISSIRVTEFAA